MTKDSKSYVIYGISKGLGKTITLNLPDKSDFVYSISRSRPDYLNHNDKIKWIPADLSDSLAATRMIRESIGKAKIDYLIYNIGIWEKEAFTNDYSFADCTVEEITSIIQTNVTSCILSIQSLLENLKKSENAKVIIIGSTWGLENHNGKEVAFSASKFALRSVVHSLRENLREHFIGVSILNLGYLDTENFENNSTTKENEHLIPVSDVIQAIRFITSSSKYSCIKEINMPAMMDRNV
jgi:short-subunit dehydrogenase